MKSSRFSTWSAPSLEHGRLTPWNWMVHHPEGLELGRDTDVGAFTYINAKHGVSIGDDVQIGSHCAIYSISTIDGKHGLVTLKKNCCLGSHSTVMPGVTIGENAVVGAHSFVNRDIPDGAIAFGCPVRIAEKRAGNAT
jgi:acetyltransferase-like isoleucine patch superfamily enzyme